MVASPYKSAYNAAKHGIAGFTKTVALETATAGNVTCNAVCPGYMFTELIENQLEATAKIRGMTKVRAQCSSVRLQTLSAGFSIRFEERSYSSAC